MYPGARRAFVAALLVACGWPAPGDARVVRFVVEQRRPIADGKSFGDAGPYERLDGTVYLEVDPRDPLNKVIVNLDKRRGRRRDWSGFRRRSTSSSRPTRRAATARSSTAAENAIDNVARLISSPVRRV